METPNAMDSVSTTLRYLATVELIPRDPKRVSTTEIIQNLQQQGFTISGRSIERDLHRLSTVFGFTCITAGRDNYWCFEPKALPRMFPMMDEHTALSFQFVEAHLKNALPPDTSEAIEPWFRMAGQRLKERSVAHARWQEKILLRPAGLQRLAPKVDQAVQHTVYAALLHEQTLAIQYRARGAREYKEHLISPLGLVVRDRVLYLVAWLHRQAVVGQFVLHRMRSAVASADPYLRPDGFNLALYAEEHFGFPMGPSKTIELIIRLRGQPVISVDNCPISPRQTLVPDGDSYLLSATVPNTLELRQWIRSLGKDAEVLAPTDLRADLAEEFVELARRYAGATQTAAIA